MEIMNRMQKKTFKKKTAWLRKFIAKHQRRKTVQKWLMQSAIIFGQTLRLLKDILYPYLKPVARFVWHIVKAILKGPITIIKMAFMLAYKLVRGTLWAIFVMPFKLVARLAKTTKNIVITAIQTSWFTIKLIAATLREFLRRPIRTDNDSLADVSYAEGSVGKAPKPKRKKSVFKWLLRRLKDVITLPLIAIRFLTLRIQSSVSLIFKKLKALALIIFKSTWTVTRWIPQTILFVLLLPFKIVIWIVKSIFKYLAFIGFIFSRGLQIAIQKLSEKIFQFLGKPAFQFSLITLTIIYVSGITYWQYKKEFFPEPLQKPLVVSETIKSFSSNVDTGMYIHNFPKFSFYTNEFVIDAVVWFKFPLGTESLDTIERFSFKNGKIIEKSKPIITQSGNMVIARYQVLADIKTHLDYRNFPFSGHRFHIILENRSVSPRELSFEVDENDFGISDKIQLSKWLPTKFHADGGYIHALVDPDDPAKGISYPAVVYAIDFANNSMRTIFSLFLPMFLSFFLGLVTFVTSVLDKYKMQLSATSLPALVIFRLVLDAQSPSRVSFTQADSIYFLLVALSLFILLFNTYVLIRTRRMSRMTKVQQDQQEYSLTYLNNFLFLVVVTTLMGVMGYIAVV